MCIVGVAADSNLGATVTANLTRTNRRYVYARSCVALESFHVPPGLSYRRRRPPDGPFREAEDGGSASSTRPDSFRLFGVQDRREAIRRLSTG